MKKLIPFTFIALIILLSACTLKEVINPDGSLKTSTNSSGANTGTGNGTNTGNGTGTTNLNNYQPVSEGSTWTYKMDRSGGSTENITITMTGNIEPMNGKSYLEYDVVSSANSPGISGTGYFNYANNLCFNRDESIAASAYKDIPYLKDNAAVNDTWSTNTDSGLPNITSKFVALLKEKDITRVVNGKTFSNVYHTAVVQRDDSGIDVTDSFSYDYYIAKGVGIIEVRQALDGVPIYTQTILSYTIK